MGVDGEIETLRAELARSFRQRLLFWFARWAIGFGLIAAIVSVKPDLAWLWWAGGVVAAISLIALLVLNSVMRRRIAEKSAAIGEVRRAARSRAADDGDTAPKL